MAKVTLTIRGASVHVPHTDGKALLTVLPNATQLGTSPKTAIDGTPLVRHWPVLWEERDLEVDSPKWLRFPRRFLGSRLRFTFTGGTPTFPDLSAIDALAAQSWLEIDPDVLRPQHDERVAGQILITTGTVAPSRIQRPDSRSPGHARSSRRGASTAWSAGSPWKSKVSSTSSPLQSSTSPRIKARSRAG